MPVFRTNETFVRNTGNPYQPQDHFHSNTVEGIAHKLAGAVTPNVNNVMHKRFDRTNKLHHGMATENILPGVRPDSYYGDLVKMAPAPTADPLGYETLGWPNNFRKLLDEAGGGLRFSGANPSEYPSFRHRFTTRYKELRQLRPDLLLQWIESTVDGEAKRFIRNAFSIFNPGQACDMVWQTLEEIYGQKEMLVENAIKQVRRSAKSIGQNRKTLLEFRADLRNLQGVLNSLNRQTALQRPQLLGSLFTALNDKLRNKLETNHLPGNWNFDTFVSFLTNEIACLDTLHVMKVEGEEGKQQYPITTH